MVMHQAAKFYLLLPLLTQKPQYESWLGHEKNIIHLDRGSLCLQPTAFLFLNFWVLDLEYKNISYTDFMEGLF